MEKKALATSWKREPFTEGTPLSYQRIFNSEEFARLREGLVPHQMEDKWFVYYEEPYLFLHRSWTGLPVYRLALNRHAEEAEVIEALWSKDLADKPGGRKDYQVRLLDFLISNLLLGESKPFPMPDDLKEPAPGIFQHHVAGTGNPQAGTKSVDPTTKPRKP